MDVLKYFYEEPASLEVLTPDDVPDARRGGAPRLSLEALLHGPRYHRGYLAGTDLASGRVGATAVARPDAFVAPLLDWLGGLAWTACDPHGRAAPLAPEALGGVLRDPSATVVLAGAAGALPGVDVAAVAEGPRRHALPALRRLLDAAYVVCYPEPAHHGYDWSFFAAHPLRAAFTDALRRHPHPDVRRFVLPFQAARSEEKFYFEQYDLERYAAYEVG